MPITVGEMLTLPGFRDMKVLAGEKGLNRRIVTGVTVIDAPDSMPWMKGGEFIVGSGYMLNKADIPFFIKFLENFEGAGISAVGIKVSRFLKQVPPEVLERAEELELPIIDIPYHYAFSDIIDPVMTAVLNQTAEKLRYSDTVSRSFFELITSGGEIQDILSHLNKFLNRNIAYHDMQTGRYFFFGENGDFQREIRESPLGDVLRRIPYESVKQHEKIYGYLLFDAEYEELRRETWEITLYHARTALLLYSQRQILKTEVENRYRNEFVHDILFNNLRFEKELWNRASLFGWDLEKPLAAAVLDIDNYKSNFSEVSLKQTDLLHAVKQRIYNIAIRYMEAEYGRIPYVTMSDSVVFLVTFDDGQKKEIFKKRLDTTLKKVAEDVKTKTLYTLSTGVGNVKKTVFQCHESYTEARKALEMTRSTFTFDSITWWSDLGVYKILGSLDDSEEARAFCDENLGELIRSDRRSKTGYINTLDVLQENNYSLKAAAADLSIHYNTLKHRLAKIEEISGLNIRNSEDRINIALSLKLYRMNNILNFIK